MRGLLWLALPVLVEHMLHMVVGLTDAYVANHLPSDAAPATAAVGTIAYVLWFVGMAVGAIGTGSTAIIARAVGARHRRLANSVCGQSVTTAAILGLTMAIVAFTFAGSLVNLTGLEGAAREFAVSYLKLLAFSMPFSTLLFAANACLRGAGDTRTPAIVMVGVDLINVFCCFGLTFGLWGLPRLGFGGIALGTVIAYTCGGITQALVLTSGRGGIRLYLHRLRPHWHTLRRLLRIGLPSGAENMLAWLAQFMIVIVINKLDTADRIMGAAHINAIRIEAVSFLTGFAFAMAAATMVGQSLDMRDPLRAARSAYLSWAVGGGVMVCWGAFFVLFAEIPASWMSANEQIADLTARCLRLAGIAQIGFSASAIFSGALRGAGDTMAVMLCNLSSIIGLRLVGVLIVAHVFGGGLIEIWMVMCAELLCRGAIMYGRFLHGGWRRIEV
jgi:putative MATE family efflux protein